MKRSETRFQCRVIFVNEIIFLIAVEYTQNENGDTVETEVCRREAFAEVKSVQQSEFHSAAAQGRRAELRLEVWEFEYGGEKYAAVRGKRFEIYRSWVRPDGICELYVSEIVGETYGKN